MSEQPVTTRKDLEDRIIAKAGKDPSYRARLLKDPKSVVQEEVHAIDPSVTLPDHLEVRVHEESASVRHLVLPRSPSDVSAPTVGSHKSGGGPAPVGALRIG